MAISDGTIMVPDPDHLTKGGLPQPGQQNILDVICLLVRTGENTLLIDTGCGRDDPTAGKLENNLRLAKIEKDDIDTVVISHAHGDHIGGNIDASGYSAFPKSRFILPRIEWDYWIGSLNSTVIRTNKNPINLAFVRRYLLPVQNQIDLVEDNAEIFPGIKIEIAPGHTPGNTIITFSSAGEKMVSVGDLIHHPVELERPDYYAMFDESPSQAIAVRNKIVAGLSSAKTLVFSPHFPFPGLGRFVLKDKTFKWQPV
jgi:glyoxylase-like metal-dependent hydrolase (beta-lactamase superfamily II)